MKKTFIALSVLFCAAMLQMTASLTSCNTPPPKVEKPVLSHEEMAERGKYLVTLGGCNHCHSPKVMTPEGPKVDETRLLSGSPAQMPMPAIDSTEITPGKWYLASGDLTAWVGPWGVSYAANLTPDAETGSGNWDEELFLKMMRTGKFMGVDRGRPIMPPMPWEDIGKMTDEDLKCIFAYLHSLPSVSNRVHEYVPPPGIKNL
ncbi:MAG TPA: c-type cytochrome [Flavobacteriales bacterium]|nr:c-type cytochrome [Flavobacteriales bacterium]